MTSAASAPTARPSSTAVVVDDRRADAAALALLLGITFVVLFESLTQPGRLILGHDVDQQFNWEIFNRHALASGQLPLWNPYVFSGFPALADFQTGLLYPPFAMLRLLPITLQSFFSWGLAFHVWVAGAGTYLLCRQAGASRPAALCGAVGFMLGGSIAPLVFAGHLGLINGFAWTPLAVLLAIRSVHTGRFTPHFGLVFVLAAQFLAGAVQPVLYTLAAIAAYALFTVCWPTSAPQSRGARLSPFVQLACIGILFAALVAFQVLPMLQLMLEAGRGSGLPYDRATKGSLHPAGLLTIFFPTAFADYATQFQDGMGGGLWEKSLYVGFLLPLMAPLALIDRNRRRLIVFFTALGVIALLMSMGEHLPFYHLHHVLLRGLRIPGRLLALWTISIAVLGAIALDVVVRQAYWRGRFKWVLGVYAVVIIGSAAIIVIEGLPDLTTRRLGNWRVVHALGPSSAVFVGVLVLLALRWLRGQPKDLRWIAIALATLDLGVFAGQFFTISGPSQKEEAARALGGPGVDRVLSVCPGELSPSSMMSLMVPTPDGQNSSYLRGYADFSSLVRGESIQQPGPTFPKMGETSSLRQIPLLNFLGVTHIHACSDLDPPFERVYEAERWQLYHNPQALPRANLVCQVLPVGSNAHAANLLQEGPVDLRQTAVALQRGSQPLMPEAASPCTTPASVQVLAKDRLDGLLRLDVTTEEAGLVVISEAYYAERQAWVDGQPATSYRANLAFTGVPVSPGTHRIELLYVPRSLYAGLAISTLTLLMWGITRLVFARRKRAPRLVTA
jgi:hypothetical protein